MTQVPVQPTTPAGWFADPNNAALTRYWDGSAWTEQTAPAAPPPGPPPYGVGVPAPPFHTPYQPAYHPQTTNGLAIASLVLSLVGLFFIGSILGIVFGFVARSQIRQSNGMQKGNGLALAGIIIGFATLAITLIVIVAIAANSHNCSLNGTC
jgi:hypothetical protein